jgi:hypothetical protein
MQRANSKEFCPARQELSKEEQKNMDWQTLLSIAGFVLFALLMMRRCGGLAGGGCGSGHARRHSSADTDKPRVKDQPTL